jgi:hypothetical protein
MRGRCRQGGARGYTRAGLRTRSTDRAEIQASLNLIQARRCKPGSPPSGTCRHRGYSGASAQEPFPPSLYAGVDSAVNVTCAMIKGQDVAKWGLRGGIAGTSPTSGSAI